MKTAALFLAPLVLAGCAPAMRAEGRKVADLQIQDAMRNYEAAERGGDPLDMCVKAKLVAAAYDDAREALDAQAWRAREREACQLAVTALGLRRGR